MDALLIIDAQENMLDDKDGVYQSKDKLSKLIALLEKARQKGIKTIHVQNNGSPGDPDEKGSTGWMIKKELQPRFGEYVIDKNHMNAFEGTNLRRIIEENKIDSLFICGFQTNYCVTETTKAILERGLNCVVIRDAHSTYDEEDVDAQTIIQKFNEEYKTRVQMKETNEVIRSWE
jgi:nicotinamidase-related amidase